MMLDDKKRMRLFRYEASWAKKEECHDVVKQTWVQNPTPIADMTETNRFLNRCKESLQKWSKLAYKNQKKLITTKFSLIKYLQEANEGENTYRIRSSKKEVEGLLEEEDLKWKQRAKQKWLKEGDKHTRFFHV